MPDKTSENQGAVTIVPLSRVEFNHAKIASLQTIFFEASATRSFADGAARAAFYDRWLGSYLVNDSSNVFLALTEAGQVVGYVVGGLQDPAQEHRYRDLTYFRQLSNQTRLYPAHLHINVASQYRSERIGARLVSSFLEHAHRCGAPGVHVVTGKGMRNVGFYLRCGFVQLAEAPWNSRTVVMLGYDLRCR